MDTLIALFGIVVVFGLGSAIGSFLNVVVYRLPAGLSLLWPPSRCPHCLHRLGKKENVPVLGWLWLKGRCKHCKTPIALRYPLVEAISGLLFVLVFWKFDLPDLTFFSLPTLGYWAFFSWLLALALIDLDTMTLPDRLTQPGLVAGLGFQAALGLGSPFNWSQLMAHLATGVFGAVLGLWLLDTITILGSLALGQPAMGAGDARLAAMMGAWLGWQSLLLAGFLACALGAFVGGGAIALRLHQRREPVPFGPFLAVGGMLAALYGEPLIGWYKQVFFPTL